MKTSVKTILVAVPFALVLGGVYWLGSSQGEAGEPSSTLPAALGVPSGTTFPASASQGAGPMPAAAAKSAEAPPVKAPLTEEEKRDVLGKFYEAAEKDIAKVESDISKARAAGKSLSDIAVLEERLEKMRQVLQQARMRHPGY